MKQIELTQGKVALVDDDDYEMLSQFKWHYYRYARRTSRSVDGKRTTIFMHRQIMNEPEALDIDHINRDCLDNRKENLRIVTASQNLRNIAFFKNNRCGHKGVSFHEPTKMFRANIDLHNKRIHLGYFKNVQDAIVARNEAVKQYHGEFGVLTE